jgi:adenosylcobyric acid synthase
MDLPDEDGVALDSIRAEKNPHGCELRIAVLRLPRISNFTDVDPLRLEPGVSVDFTTDPGGLEGVDMAVIPGSKNTLADLEWLKKRGFPGALRGLIKRGGTVAGICGGFQMMGDCIKDPLGVESSMKQAEGLGLINASTVLKGDKRTFQVTAELKGMYAGEGISLRGYEIHMGETGAQRRPFATVTERNSEPVSIQDGYVSEDGRLWGTYIHGVFDNDRFRQRLLNGLREKKGLPARTSTRGFSSLKEDAISKLAGVVREGLDMDRLYNIIGI